MRISDWSSDVCSSDLVQLDDLAAGIQLSDGPAKIAAPGGRYNMDSEKVALDGPITVRTASGYALDTKDATVDLQARTMASDGGVSRSEERRVGKEWVSSCRSRGGPNH